MVGVGRLILDFSSIFKGYKAQKVGYKGDIIFFEEFQQ